MTTLDKNNRSLYQRHSHSLLPYLLISFLLHGLAAFLVLKDWRSPITETKPQPEKNPIEFVLVPPEKTPTQPPPKTQRRAATNSVARGKKSDSEKPPVLPAPVNTTPSVETTRRIVPSPEKSTPSPPVAKTEPTQPIKPTLSKTEKLPIKPAPSEPVAPSNPQSTPKSSGSANLLAGNYRRSFQDDAGSSFFNLEAKVSEEAPYASIDAQQGELAPYFDEIRRRVKQNWQPSFPGDKRISVLAFAIQRDGQITGLRIIQTSGNERVDRDALEAVQKSAPFNALPATFKSDLLEIQFNFNIYVY